MTPDATILAKHFQVGRRDPRQGFQDVRLVVLHTTENPCAPGVAFAVAHYFAGADAPEASAHYVVGPDATILCVPEAHTAWHAPPANFYSIGVEQTGRAAFEDADWQSENAQAMLARSAVLVADLCDRYGIPVVFVDAAGLVAGQAGITTHAEVSKAFRVSDHTDPGARFPMDAYLAAVAAARAPLQ